MINLYRILEVENFAPMEVVTRSFRRLVMIHHPDRGGNQEVMKKINSAYDGLKRYKTLYDQRLREYLNPRQPVYAFTVDIVSGFGTSSNTTAWTGYEYTF
jgi:curved DNA-binding protein CbpA